MTNYLEIEPEAARQYVDARTAFSELERSSIEAGRVRGGMVWKAVKGTEYLIRTSASSAQKSLGPRTPATEKIYAEFIARKDQSTGRMRDIKAAVHRHERLNRALRVGRMPGVAVDVLRRLNETGLDEYFRVVGTHALYAYETAAGVRLDSEVTSTMDIDLLWDTRRRVVFAERLARNAPSMLGVLQKVDKTFVVKPEQQYTAINSKGFEVDILRRELAEDDPHPIRLSDDENDFWVVQAKRAGDLMNATGFSEIVVSQNGTMARLNTIHPAAFAEFKRWMAQQQDRDPIKRRRDVLQAEAVEWLLSDRLAHLAVQA
jgi:hypothetical protein